MQPVHAHSDVPAAVATQVVAVGGVVRTLASRWLHGAAWSVVGSVGSRAVTLLTFVLVARQIGKQAYGEFGVVQSTIGIFSLFAALGIGLTATRHVAQFRSADPARAGRVLALSAVTAWTISLALAFALALFAPWLAAEVLAAPHLTTPLRISSLLLVLGGLNAAQVGALSGFEAFRGLALANLLAGAIAFPLIVVGAWWHGLEGVLLGMAAGLAVSAAVNAWTLRCVAAESQVPLTLAGCWREWPLLLSFSVPAVLGGMLVGLAEWFCPVLLIGSPEAYVQLGAWNAARDWFLVVAIIPNLLGQVFLPIMSERLGSGRRDECRRAFFMNLKLNVLLVLPVAIAGSLASPFILACYGSEFRAEWPTLALSFLTAFVVVLAKPSEYLLHSAGKVWQGVALNALFVLVYFTASKLLLDRGAAGIATARLIAFGIHCVCLSGYVARRMLLESAGMDRCLPAGALAERQCHAH